ncbi:MAG: response regulator, partial [Anaerolineae bacterium]|nr:response regulator [Anaerolineae bacterium]
MINWNDVSTWTVLVVDDEPDNLEVVAETLEFHKATVKTAVDGVQALELLQDFVPNIILLDLSMPRMDGWKTRLQIKSDPRFEQTAIIALSAHAMDGDIERALKAGFDGYITKPVDIANLADSVRTAAIDILQK